MDRKKWQKNAALRIKAVRTVGLLDQGVPVDTALNYANSEYKEALAAIDRPTIAELKSTMDAKCTAAGLPPVLIPGTATEYKSGGRSSTFTVDGRPATYAEFRAVLGKHGIDAAKVEKRITMKAKGERITTREVVQIAESITDAKK